MRKHRYNKKSKTKILLIGLKRPVLDVLFCWLDNNYEKEEIHKTENSRFYGNYPDYFF